MSYASLILLPFRLSSPEWLMVTFCVTAMLLVFFPVAAFLVVHWTEKRDGILRLLNAQVIPRYYRRFYPCYDKEVDGLSDRELETHFSKHFHWRYGRWRYVVPAALLLLLTAVTAVPVIQTLFQWFAHDQGGQLKNAPLSQTMMAAFAGAFMWVIADEFNRFRKSDLTPYDLCAYIVRVLVAVPFGWAIYWMTGQSPSIGIPVAFMLGAFPTRSLLKISRRLVFSKLKIGDEPSDDRASELEKLQSISKPAAERFTDEGIGSIVELAYSDPIDLTMRTNFDFNYIRDCISQALIWIYFPNEKLQHLALRGAMEAGNLIKDHELYHAWTQGVAVEMYKPDELYCPRPTNDDEAPAYEEYCRELQERRHRETEKAISDAAASLKISSDALMTTLRQVAYDPYTMLLLHIWRSRKKPAAVSAPLERARTARAASDGQGFEWRITEIRRTEGGGRS